jgi:CheY-like chemotaxis protein
MMNEVRPTILIVDDNRITTKLMRRYLEANGFDAREAYDGIECLESIRGSKPDFVIMDIMMPRMDGLSAVRALKSDPLTADVPVAILTALNDVETQTKAVEAGADDFLTKPIEEKLIVTKARMMSALARERKRVERLSQTITELRNGSSVDVDAVLRELGLSANDS